jgi:hypothetical protein
MNHFKEILTALKRLKSKYPTFQLGRHIDTATSDYGNIWSLTDKEMLHALEKYEAELELNGETGDYDVFVDDVVKDADNLNMDDGEE